MNLIRTLIVDTDKKGAELDALKKDIIDKVNDAAHKAALKADPKDIGAVIGEVSK